MSQVMLICRYIKMWVDLFRNIDFHTAGMKNDIGHHLQCVSTQLWTVTIEIASNTWTGSQREEGSRSCSLAAGMRPLSTGHLHVHNLIVVNSLLPFLSHDLSLFFGSSLPLPSHHMDVSIAPCPLTSHSPSLTFTSLTRRTSKYTTLIFFFNAAFPVRPTQEGGKEGFLSPCLSKRCVIKRRAFQI